MVDAEPDSGALQGRVGWAEAEGGHHVQGWNGARPRVHRAVFAHLTLTGRTARWRGLTEEVLDVEELHGVSVQPALGESVGCLFCLCRGEVMLMAHPTEWSGAVVARE